MPPCFGAETAPAAGVLARLSVAGAQAASAAAAAAVPLRARNCRLFSASRDVVLIAPNEKHWHGAAPTTAMTHIAVQEALDGEVVDWMEKVSDEEYQA